MCHVYFAAPLFTLAEKQFNLTLAEALREMGFRIHLPQEFVSASPDQPGFYEIAFKGCVAYIDRSDALIAIADGPDADSGTCFEIGYAYARGLPVILVRTDFRSSEDDGVNLMLSQCATHYVRDTEGGIDALAESIGACLRRVSPANESNTPRA